MNKIRLFLIKLLGGEQVHILYVDRRRRSVLHHQAVITNPFVRTIRMVRLDIWGEVFIDASSKKVEWRQGPPGRKRRGKVITST